MPQRYQSVDAVPSQPPRYSLLTVAGNVDDDHRFTEGIRWLPEWVGNGAVAAIDPDKGNTAAMAGSITTPIPAELTADPILLWAGEKASALGSFGRDYAGRVRRKLLATESFQAAQELWDGAIGLPAGHAQTYLTDIGSDRLTAIGTPAAVGAVFGLIEDGLDSVLSGQRGMIHCTTQILSHALQSDCVINAGTPAQPLWVTPTGHVVVADAGYSGNGPGAGGENDADATSQWVMATDMVSVRLGAIAMKPQDIATREAVDYNVNDVIVLAQRPCVFQWNTNVHVAAEVNIGIAAVGGAS